MATISRGSIKRFFSEKTVFSREFKFRNIKEDSIERNLTPKKIFELLDRRVVGQAAAKRMLAIAYSRSV